MPTPETPWIGPTYPTWPADSTFTRFALDPHGSPFPTPTEPVVMSLTVPPAGDALVCVFNLACNGVNGFGPIESLPRAPNVGTAVDTGEGTDTYTLTLTRTVYAEDACRISYTPGDVVTVADGTPLETFTDFGIINGSTQHAPAPTVFVMTVAADGVSGSIEFTQFMGAVASGDGWILNTPRGDVAVVLDPLPPIGDTYTFTLLGGYALSGETVTVDYAPGDTENCWGVALGAISGGDVTNDSDAVTVGATCGAASTLTEDVPLTFLIPGGNGIATVHRWLTVDFAAGGVHHVSFADPLPAGVSVDVCSGTCSALAVVSTMFPGDVCFEWTPVSAGTFLLHAHAVTVDDNVLVVTAGAGTCAG